MAVSRKSGNETRFSSGEISRKLEGERHVEDFHIRKACFYVVAESYRVVHTGSRVDVRGSYREWAIDSRRAGRPRKYRVDRRRA